MKGGRFRVFWQPFPVHGKGFYVIATHFRVNAKRRRDREHRHLVIVEGFYVIAKRLLVHERASRDREGLSRDRKETSGPRAGASRDHEQSLHVIAKRLLVHMEGLFVHAERLLATVWRLPDSVRPLLEVHRGWPRDAPATTCGKRW